MNKTSKSPKAIALVAYVTAKKTLPPYSNEKSPHRFTQPQLIACLVLKEFFKTDYRGIMEILTDSSDLQKILELTEIPHYTTLQKASKRLTGKKTTDQLMKKMIELSIKARIVKKTVALSAIDSTGFESHYTSAYFVKRKAKGGEAHQTTTYTRFPKVGFIADCESYLILGGTPSWGPSPDILHFKNVLIETTKNIKLRTLTADAGYDAEHAHQYAREELGIKTIIPNRIGRPTTKLPSGKYRKIMATRFNKKLYGQRWQIETINSIIKRRLNSFLRAKTYFAQMREMMFKLFTYNIMVVRLS